MKKDLLIITGTSLLPVFILFFLLYRKETAGQNMPVITNINRLYDDKVYLFGGDGSYAVVSFNTTGTKSVPRLAEPFALPVYREPKHMMLYR